MSSIFLSYARRDGQQLASHLHERLAATHVVWQDVFDMHGGDDWWLQIEDRIAKAHAVVLVVTRAAFESDIVRREWVHARRAGIHILPVAADNSVFRAAPRWLTKVDIFVLSPGSPDYETTWRRFHEQLQNPSPPRPVPFTVPTPPVRFLRREQEHRRVIESILDSSRQNPVSSNVVISGPPGIGKTTLVQDACHDPTVSDAFTGGILWAAPGSDGRGALTGLNAMVKALSGRTAAFNSEAEAANRLNELLETRDCLLVLDDVWDVAHIEPFLRSAHCARLITTRTPERATPDGAAAVELGEMLPFEAAAVLRLFLPLDTEADPFLEAHSRLTMLASRLGQWPLLLHIFGGALHREMTVRGASIETALDWIQQGLDEAGLVAFDRSRSEDRQQALAASIAVSLRAYSEDEKQRLLELSIFNAHDPVPQQAVDRLWAATAQMSPFKAGRLLREFSGTFLQLSADPEAGAYGIRFYEAMREYLAGQLGHDRARQLHCALLDSYNPGGAPWHAVAGDGYYHDHLAYHLAHAGRTADLYNLIDKPWMSAQLRRTRTNHAFLRDVDAAIAHARAERPVNLVQVVRGALIAATLRSLSSSASPEMLGIMAADGEIDAASDHAALIPHKASQAEAYRAIAAALRASYPDNLRRDLFDAALDAANQATDAGKRAQVLGEIAATLARCGEITWARHVTSEGLEAAKKAGHQDRMTSLAAIGRALLAIGDKPGAMGIAGEMLKEARAGSELGYVGNIPMTGADAVGIALVASLLAEAEDMRQAAEIASEAHRTAHNILKKVNQVAAVRALAWISAVHLRVGDTTSSARAADEMMTLARQTRGQASAAALVEAAAGLVRLDRLEDAASFANEALAAAPGIPDESNRRAVTGRAAVIFADVGDRSRARDLVKRALESPWSLDGSMSKTAALTATAEALVEAGQAERSAEIAAEALASSHAILDLGMLPNVWSHIGGLLRTPVALESALATPGAVRAGIERAWILYGAVRDRAERGDKEAAASLIDQTMKVLSDEDDDLQRAVVANNVALTLAKAGWRDMAAEVSRRAAGWADEIDDGLRRAYALAMVASSEADAGGRSDGERMAERAHEAASKIDDDKSRFQALGAAARALAKAGRHAEALRTAQRIPNLDYELSALIAVASVAAERGEFHLVEAIVRETALGNPENWPELAQVQSAMALGHARHGAGDAALDLARRAHPTQSDDMLAAVSAALVEQEDFDRAIQAAIEIADPDAKAAALSRLAPLLAATGQVQRALEISELPEAWKSIALTRVAYRTAEAGDLIQARQLVDRALPAGRRAVDVSQKLEVLIDAARAYSLIGAQDSVLALLAEAFAAAGAAGRDNVFHVVQRSAAAFARIDRGESLWASSRQAVEIDGWWLGNQNFKS